MASADGKAPPTQPDSSAPLRCTAGCGFFGNAATGGMCSKCYKETVAKSAVAPAPSTSGLSEPVAAVSSVPTAPPPPPAQVASVAPSVAPVAALPKAASPESVPAPATEAPSVAQVRPPDAVQAEDEPPKKVQVNTSRCWTCNRKIGLTGFQCKCDFFFCAEHRYSDRHECTFDFKQQGKQLLSKANPTIAPAKLESI